MGVQSWLVQVGFSVMALGRSMGVLLLVVGLLQLFEVELQAAMHDIERALDLGWSQIWLDSGS